MQISMVLVFSLEMGGLLLNGEIPSWDLSQIKEAGYGNYLAAVMLLLCVGAGQMILLKEDPTRLQMMIGIPSFVMAVIVSLISLVSTDTIYMSVFLLSFIIFVMNWKTFIDVAKSGINK